MREIKFRGKTTKTNRWAYGFLVIIEDKYYIVLDDACLDYSWEKDVIEGFVKVTPKTVGQYIESKDIEGNEIYEGDKIRWYPNKPKNHIDNIVEYIGNKFSLGDWYEDDYPNTEGQCKIIGNIFDNPELRGGKS